MHAVLHINGCMLERSYLASYDVNAKNVCLGFSSLTNLCIEVYTAAIISTVGSWKFIIKH